MSETKDTADKPLTPGGRKPLSLQRTVESGHVRQSFSHGRSKSVVVEKRKTRKLATPGAPAEREAGQPAAAAPAPAAAPKAPSRPASEARGDAGKSDLLRPEERDARARALAEARKRAVEDAQRAEEERRNAPPPPPEAPTPVVEAPAAKAEPAAAPAPAPAARAAPAPSAAPAARQPAGDRGASRPPIRSRSPGSNDTRFAPREGGRPMQIEIPRPPSAAPAADRTAGEVTKIVKDVRAPRPVQTSDDDESRAIKRGGKLVRVPVKAPTTDTKRERGKLTINNALDEQQRERSLASLKRKREREKLKAMGIQQPRDKIVREVTIPEAITIQELSNRMTERGVDVIRFLMKEGAMHKITDVIDADTAELIVQEFGHTPKRVSEADVETGFIGEKDAEEAQKPRAPVVTIMGHVDHGKTSLLDAIRKTNVVSGEAGGITQHIGAYQVTTPSGGKVTFIDTPGHAAFTAMRARGAKVTDIVVLVVAADDGVMPQTAEAINHAKAANVPIIVAINKIDKPAADPKRVQTDLLSHEIVVESMGGETLEVPVSALKGTNLDKLLETIHLQAEVLDLKANPDRSAEGIVIEAKLERGRGPVGTVLVQRGTLRVGDIVVAGTAWGRVRALIDDQGKNVDAAGPSFPVEVLGFDSAPEAGDQIAVVENEARAREITDYRIRKRRETLGSAGTPRTLEQMMQTLKDSAGKKDFTLLIKGDVQGSLEAIQGSLKKLGTDEVEARVVHSGVGGITESDIALAGASKAVVVGFNVRANAQAKQVADSQGIEIRYYSIIYDLVDDVKAAMSGLLAPTVRENFLGYATIKQVFNVSKVGKVAGCLVTEGRVERGAKVRLLRDKVVIHEGTLSILKRFKDDVKEVPVGQECGMAFANYQDIREGDEIECFQVETIKRSL
ncbi:translation initiation factor IF-2 [Hyphomicrobium nitrativorans NL23]|uniref:Translation initiation factor IF-2 n=1 Tax=Hyphomicrobium nitrativorans NL23 TaxID=1029756 RepID=V5SE20_9HYPH|nr:translation initiation factor IF-2 [Hyphomicrobium nitrativorans]AHB48290.1 translation initiation factor IF-2 [Hyphomicrobium nitrativorans NL23]